MVWGLQHVAKYNEHAGAANRIRVYVACLRLPAYDADIVISYNSPVWISGQSASADVIDKVQSNLFWSDDHVAAEFQALLRSFAIHDYSLFPGGE